MGMNSHHSFFTVEFVEVVMLTIIQSPSLSVNSRKFQFTKKKKERKCCIGKANLRLKDKSKEVTPNSDNILSELSKTLYIPSESEKKILICGLNHYFSLPNNSKERKSIISQISKNILQISQHWDHKNIK